MWTPEIQTVATRHATDPDLCVTCVNATLLHSLIMSYHVMFECTTLLSMFLLLVHISANRCFQILQCTHASIVRSFSQISVELDFESQH